MCAASDVWHLNQLWRVVWDDNGTVTLTCPEDLPAGEFNISYIYQIIACDLGDVGGIWPMVDASPGDAFRAFAPSEKGDCDGVSSLWIRIRISQSEIE